MLYIQLLLTFLEATSFSVNIFILLLTCHLAVDKLLTDPRFSLKTASS